MNKPEKVSNVLLFRGRKCGHLELPKVCPRGSGMLHTPGSGNGVLDKGGKVDNCDQESRINSGLWAEYE